MAEYRKIANPKVYKIISVALVIVLVILIGFFVFLKFSQNKTPTKEVQLMEGDGKVKVTQGEAGYSVSAPLSVPISSVTNKATEIAGFRIYYPSFIPKEFKVTANIANIVTSKTIADCTLRGSDSSPIHPEITILEKPVKSGDNNPFKGGIDTLISKQTIDINGVSGFGGTGTTADGATSRVVYITKDGTAIQMQSKDFNLDLLLKVARSMQ